MNKNNIILCGFMGCGKTTVGRQLAKLTNREFVDTDEYIETKVGLTIGEIFRKCGEAYFRTLETTCIMEIAKNSKCIIATGGGTVLLPQNVSLLKCMGKIFFLEASFDVLLNRITQDISRPLVCQLSKLELKELFDERLEKYITCADFITNAACNCQEVCNHILELLNIIACSHKKCIED